MSQSTPKMLPIHLVDSNSGISVSGDGTMGSRLLRTPCIGSCASSAIRLNPFKILVWKELWMIVGYIIFIILYVLLLMNGMTYVINATKNSEVIPPIAHPRYINTYTDIVAPTIRAAAFLSLLLVPPLILHELIRFIEKRRHKSKHRTLAIS